MLERASATLMAPADETHSAKCAHMLVADFWRAVAGCPSWTAFLPTGAVLCPGFCTTYREGKSSGATGAYGRLWYDEIRNTVTLQLSFMFGSESLSVQPLLCLCIPGSAHPRKKVSTDLNVRLKVYLIGHLCI